MTDKTWFFDVHFILLSGYTGSRVGRTKPEPKLYFPKNKQKQFTSKSYKITDPPIGHQKVAETATHLCHPQLTMYVTVWENIWTLYGSTATLAPLKKSKHLSFFLFYRYLVIKYVLKKLMKKTTGPDNGTKSQRITKVNTIHPEWNVNVWKFNWSQNNQNQKNKNVNPMMVQDKKPFRYIFWEPWKSV